MCQTQVCSLVFIEWLSQNSYMTCYVLHVSQTLYAACEPYFVCCMPAILLCCTLVRNTWVRLYVLHTSKTLCAALGSVFSCELSAILCQIRTKAFNKMACKQNMIKCMDTQKITFCWVYSDYACSVALCKHNRDVLIIGLAIISVADMLLFCYIGISTVCPESQYFYQYSACKIFLFNAHHEVCNWLKDFKIAFILCSSLYND